MQQHDTHYVSGLRIGIWFCNQVSRIWGHEQQVRFTWHFLCREEWPETQEGKKENGGITFAGKKLYFDI
jgi:hypothetical protein